MAFINLNNNIDNMKIDLDNNLNCNAFIRNILF